MYQSRIALAERYWLADTVGRYDAILNECPPTNRDWEWRHLKNLGRSERLRRAGSAVAYSPNGRWLATAARGAVEMRDAATGTVRRTDAKVWVAELAFSHDGTQLAAVCKDSIRVWDVASGSQRHKMARPAGLFNISLNAPLPARVAWRPDGRQIACAYVVRNAIQVDGLPAETCIWDADAGHHIGTIQGDGQVLAYSPDGRRLVLAATVHEPHDDHNNKRPVLKVYDADDRRELATYQTVGVFAATGVAFSPDGSRLAVAQRDKDVTVLNAATGVETARWRGHANEVLCVASSADGRAAATGDQAGTAKLWDARSGDVSATLRGHASPVYHVAFSPDSRSVASADETGTTLIRDVARRQAANLPAQLPPNTIAAALSPDRTNFTAFVADDRGPQKVGIFDAVTGRERFPLHTLAVTVHPVGSNCGVGRP